MADQTTPPVRMAHRVVEDWYFVAGYMTGAH